MQVRISHEMSVTQIWEAPRVTKPYTEEQWQAIDRIGHAVDVDLKANDVRLTMGGEPTFVSMDDPEAEEWSTAALGPNKRRLAAEVYQRLRAHYGAQGLVHFGQGKWYPGEQLPRWSLNCYWRADGEPIWRNDLLIADETQPGLPPPNSRVSFSSGRSAATGLRQQNIFPHTKTCFTISARAHRLPSNVDPFDSRCRSARTRAAHGHFSQVLNSCRFCPAARARSRRERWRSGRVVFCAASVAILVPR